MQRKIREQMLSWKKNSNGRTALLIDGARRVGKSYAAESFARENYRSYILIDFNEVGSEITNLFEENLRDLDSLFLLLQATFNVKLYERESLIILDEIQLCPRARAAIKFLVADGRYDYIETSSLMSIRNNVQNIVIPSEEKQIRMYPMDFEEFLWAKGEVNLLEYIRNCYSKKQPMGQALHRKTITLFREYLIVGGMPQAVKEYISTQNFEAVDMIKRDILNLYRTDIAKHANGFGQKLGRMYDEIPAQLSKHEKKFTLSSLGRGTRFRDYESAFLWLEDSTKA